MYASKFSRTESVRDSGMRLGVGALKLMGRALQVTLYTVLKAASGYVLFTLGLLSGGLLLVWFIFRVLAGDTEFHTFTVVGSAVLFAVAMVVYCPVLELLRPE